MHMKQKQACSRCFASRQVVDDRGPEAGLHGPSCEEVWKRGGDPNKTVELSFWHLICDCQPARPQASLSLRYTIHTNTLPASTSRPTTTTRSCRKHKLAEHPVSYNRHLIWHFSPYRIRDANSSRTQEPLLTPIPPFTIISKQQPCLRRSRPRRFVITMVPDVEEHKI
jgi:hypothetical protein